MRAIVVDGFGAATEEVPKVADFLPFVPFPGTLNVNLAEPVEWAGESHGLIPWFGYSQEWTHATVNGSPCVVLGLVSEMPVGHKLELIAPVRLRDSVRDGEVVEVACGQ